MENQDLMHGLNSWLHAARYSAANLHLALGTRLGPSLAALLRYQVTWLNFGSASARTAQPAQAGALLILLINCAQSRFWAPLLLNAHASS